MNDDTTAHDRSLLAAMAGLIAVASIVVIVDAGAGRPKLAGVGLQRLGQLLFVLGFAAGAGHFLRRDATWLASGSGLFALAWALLFAEGWLNPALGGEFMSLVLIVLTLGGVFVVVGVVADTRLQAVLSRDPQLSRQ
ncbi:MAG: hypothetical protein ABEJ31_05080 [Haloarculaceae archaeon]